MRIISGKFKKKKLFLPDSTMTRPLRDYVKESLFNQLLHSKIIKFNFNNSIILDIFSGSGSFGIECLSRGSKKIYFVENNIKVIKILLKNINSIKIENKVEIIKNDFLKKSVSSILKESFNLIFLDPPFNYQYWDKLLKKIKLFKKSSPECIVVLHYEEKNSFVFEEHLKIISKKKYGVSVICFAKLKE